MNADATPPSSTVQPLPAIAAHAQFQVTWAGQDNAGGSGIAFYDIYVSVDGSPFTLWLGATTAVSAEYQGAENHTYAFYSVATDVAGNVQPTPAAAQAQTTVPVANTQPDLTTGGNATLAEGGYFVRQMTIVDPDAGDSWTITVDFGDGSAPQDVSVNPDQTLILVHRYNDNGSYALNVTVSDSHHASRTRGIQVDVSNVAPTAHLVCGARCLEGSTSYLAFRQPYDPSAADTAAGFTYSYDFNNDGTYEIVNSTSPVAVVPASYLVNGPSIRMCRARIMDKDGGSTAYTVALLVLNAPPTVVAGPNTTAGAGQPFAATGYFTDPGVNDTHTATVDYGDGNGPQLLALTANRTFTLGNTYTQPGTYKITVRVVDNQNAVGMSTRLVTVSLVNLNAMTVINDGGAQRSLISSITCTFNTAIDHFDAGAFELRSASGALITVSAANPTDDPKTYVLTFSGAGTDGTSLADGRYTLTLHAQYVHDVYSQTLAGGDAVLTFHRLFGDGDGDAYDSALDLAAFRKSLNKKSTDAGYVACFDYDGDGAITLADYAQFNLRLGQRI